MCVFSESSSSTVTAGGRENGEKFVNTFGGILGNSATFCRVARLVLFKIGDRLRLCPGPSAKTHPAQPRHRIPMRVGDNHIHQHRATVDVQRSVLDSAHLHWLARAIKEEPISSVEKQRNSTTSQGPSRDNAKLTRPPQRQPSNVTHLRGASSQPIAPNPAATPSFPPCAIADRRPPSAANTAPSA